MSAFTWLLFLSCLTFAPVANAHTAIGPVADLVLTNENIAPDGHPRIAAVAGGMMPGPLIRGNKVCHGFRSLRYVDSSTTGVQGDRFQINVHDQLTDDDLFTPTSIVSSWPSFWMDIRSLVYSDFDSIGMASFNMEPTGRTVSRWSLNVL